MATTTIDEEAIKSRQQATWSSGDYSVIGTTLQITGEMLCEAVDVGAGERVLDVAAGNGNAALAAARRGASVTATDYVPELLGRARRACRGRGSASSTYAKATPRRCRSPDATFDVVLSTFGVMFTPNQERAASELLRVCRPGGRIGLASWTPEGFVGEMFKIVGPLRPPAGRCALAAPMGKRGTRRRAVREPSATLTMQRRDFVFRYRSPEHWLDAFRSYYGPIHKAFASLDRAGQGAFRARLARPRGAVRHRTQRRVPSIECLSASGCGQGGVAPAGGVIHTPLHIGRGKLVCFAPGLDALWRDAEVDVRVRFQARVEAGVHGERIGELSASSFIARTIASMRTTSRVGPMPTRALPVARRLRLVALTRRASQRRGPFCPRRMTVGSDTERCSMPMRPSSRRPR